MRRLTKPGRTLFAIASVAFGFQHLVFAVTGVGLGPPWTPLARAVGYLAGVAFVVCGVLFGRVGDVSIPAMLVSVACLTRVAVYYVPQMIATPRDPGPWTSTFELIALSGASLMLVAAGPASSRLGERLKALARPGHIAFAISLIVFGVQHLMYGPFVAGLIPEWIPFPVFWAYACGAGFLGAAVAILFNRLASLAGACLGIMFLVWVLILHAPRVWAAPSNGNEWTSLFVALAMSGGSFVSIGMARDAAVVATKPAFAK